MFDVKTTILVFYTLKLAKESRPNADTTPNYFDINPRMPRKSIELNCNINSYVSRFTGKEIYRN